MATQTSASLAYGDTTGLTPDQVQQIYAARPDVQQNVLGYRESSKKQTARVERWYNNYLSGGGKAIVSASPLEQMQTTAMGNLQGAIDMTYEFDPNKYLPGIKQQAESIYAPQKAQLEAIRQLQSAQAEDTRITTVKDFDKQLQGEIEAINRRGAYFSGGAIENEQDIMDNKVRALNMIGLQAQAADFQNLAQQGILGAEEAQFIQDRLYNAEGSAYARWTDQRNFSFQAAVQQYQIYTDERNFVRSVFESDRTFTESVRQFEKNYAISKAQLDMAKTEFKTDMKIKNLSYDQALYNFKKTTAVKNSGLFGLTDLGTDQLDSIASEFNGLGGTANTNPSYYTQQGGVIDLDSNDSIRSDNSNFYGA